MVHSNLNQLDLWSEFKKFEGFKTLNAKQKKFFEEVFQGHNVFLTGPAGTGKSYCLSMLFNFLDKKGIFVAKTALTGVAALNIGGSTVHSWAGLGLADKDVQNVIDDSFKNKRAREKIRNSSILFIDEVSMASADLLNKLDAVLQAHRMNIRPFGGIQVIFSGDFLQLPPVSKGYGKKLEFAFQSDSWKHADIHTISLTKLVRQDETTAFAKVLQNIRFGKTKDLEILASRINAKLDTEIEPIKIFCKNVDIDAYNNAEFNKLSSAEQTYYAKDTGDVKYSAYFDRNCPAPGILKLRIGAQVMLLVNIDVEGGLVNGSLGVVDGFSPLGPIVKFVNGEKAIIDNNKWEIKEQELDLTGKMRYHVVATRTQVPLKLAWATSVHRVQGSTLDYAKLDLSEAFEYGMAYVGLSRVKTLEGLSLKDFSPNRIKAHPDCLEFYKKAK